MRGENRSEMRHAMLMRLEKMQLDKLAAMSDALGLTKAEVVRRLIDEARYSPVIIDVEIKGARKQEIKNGQS